MTTIIKERLKALDSITLQRGAHDPNGDKQMCAMEAAAWIAGEEHSDHPKCVSPVLAAFVREWNDALDDEERQTLKPYIPRMIGTAGDGHDKERTWMAADWMVRVCTPAWLDLAGLKDSAKALRSLPPVTKATVGKAQPTVKKAREMAIWARDATGAAAWAVVRARTAARDAVRAAAWTAAWAATGAAAGAAAWIAWDAAGAAVAKAKLDSEPGFEAVKAELQRSAHELLDRMIDGPFGGENA